MSRTNLIKWVVRSSATIPAAISAALVLLLTHPAAVAAQCIMCYLSATASGERGSHVLRMGIIVLVIPTMLTFAGVFLLAYRRRNPVEWLAEPPTNWPDELPIHLEEESSLASRDQLEHFLPNPADQQSQSPSIL